MKYNKNKSIQITFTIRESLYFKFKTLCKSEKKMPATVLKEFIKSKKDIIILLLKNITHDIIKEKR